MTNYEKQEELAKRIMERFNVWLPYADDKAKDQFQTLAWLAAEVALKHLWTPEEAANFQKQTEEPAAEPTEHLKRAMSR